MGFLHDQDRDVLITEFWFRCRKDRMKPAERVRRLEVLLQFYCEIMLAANYGINHA